MIFWLRRIERKLDLVIQLLTPKGPIMSELDTITASVANVEAGQAAQAAETAKENTLLSTIHAELVAALAAGADPAALQALADRLGAVVTAQQGTVAAVQAAEAANPDPNAPPAAA